MRHGWCEQIARYHRSDGVGQDVHSVHITVLLGHLVHITDLLVLHLHAIRAQVLRLKSRLLVLPLQNLSSQYSQ